MITALQHVPAWVFVLLAALVAVGVSQSFPHQVRLRRVTILPVVLIGLSLTGVVTAFGSQPLALLAWAGGLAAAVAALHGRVDTSAVRFSAQTQHFSLPGSWVPLMLLLGLFAIKFGVGMMRALHPELASSASLALPASAAYGVFSGLFLGRAMALWSLAREALSLQSA